MAFLKARWENLILINYSINPELIKPYLPIGTVLDVYNNTCYVSLVGFMFKNTKVLGLKIPNYAHFEEVNLRFYVKRKVDNEWRRGVVFIKEIVPKSLITLIANTIYHEHYETRKMTHEWLTKKHSKSFAYGWTVKNTNQNIKVETETNPKPITTNSEAEFITEHYFGYTKRNNTTYEYEVMHPKWEQLMVKNFDINVDFELNYGKCFRVLNGQKPKSVLLAIGSEVSVKNKLTIKG